MLGRFRQKHDLAFTSRTVLLHLEWCWVLFQTQVFLYEFIKAATHPVSNEYRLYDAVNGGVRRDVGWSILCVARTNDPR